ncbi:AAA family ATPase [Ideonella paludis]|uniref:AAA family ATPase n=1 Tax=Ideonella paludis TaxID=1233411 RepID=UPI0036292920
MGRARLAEAAGCRAGRAGARAAPREPPALLLGVALLSHLEGQGHTCMPLQALHTQRSTWLPWPPAGQAALDALWPLLPTQEAQWLSVLAGQPTVREPQQPDHGQPLVLAQHPLRLYLRRHHADEQVVAQHLSLRSQAAQDAPAPSLLRPVLDQLFGAAEGRPLDWQRQACALAVRARLGVITGGPGTGKTYTAARLLATVLATTTEPSRLRIALAAPTGKAAARLKLSIADALLTLPQVTSPTTGETLHMPALVNRLETARTLHAWLGARPDTRQFARHAGDPLAVDVMIVDEASMIHLEMMAALLDALPTQARLVLLGDKDQLASVEAGAVLGDLCQGAEREATAPTPPPGCSKPPARPCPPRCWPRARLSPGPAHRDAARKPPLQRAHWPIGAGRQPGRRRCSHPGADAGRARAGR